MMVIGVVGMYQMGSDGMLQQYSMDTTQHTGESGSKDRVVFVLFREGTRESPGIVAKTEEESVQSTELRVLVEKKSKRLQILIYRMYANRIPYSTALEFF
jgi:hypothetical protein